MYGRLAKPFRISIHAPTRGATKIRGGASRMILISIHAPTRGATEDLKVIFQITQFQSTLPRGERRNWRGRTGYQHYFNPRSHEGSDSDGQDKYQDICRFQSTLPRGERPASDFYKRFMPGDFNPRSHEGSDGREWRDCRCCSISIHAPTRGATRSIG